MKLVLFKIFLMFDFLFLRFHWQCTCFYLPRRKFSRFFEWNDIYIHTILPIRKIYFWGQKVFFHKFWRSVRCYLYPYLHHQKVLFSVRSPSNRSIRKLWLFEASKDLIIISKLEVPYQTIFNLKLKLATTKEKLFVHQRLAIKKVSYKFSIRIKGSFLILWWSFWNRLAFIYNYWNNIHFENAYRNFLFTSYRT